MGYRPDMDFFYGTSSGNSSRVDFALHEARATYVPHALQVPRGESRSAQYLALNPMGKGGYDFASTPAVRAWLTRLLARPAWQETVALIYGV